MSTHPISASASRHTGRRARGRDIHEQHRTATPLELLLDLSFVVAIALAASQLHHGVMDHQTGPALAGFVAAFVAIWWAWMNYTWFASAYDDDSAVFRLLTMLQMGGVLVFATGVPGLFSGDFRVGVLGYAIMRLALVAQWLLAARAATPRARPPVAATRWASRRYRCCVSRGCALRGVDSGTGRHPLRPRRRAGQAARRGVTRNPKNIQKSIYST